MHRQLDPDIAAFLRAAAEAGGEAITAGSIKDARANNAAFLRQMAPETPAVASVTEMEITSGERLVPMRIIEPNNARPGVIIFFHGGGWVLGDLEGHDALCRIVASATSRRVINVNYAHAPENPFPAAVEDCAAAVRWAAMNYAAEPLVVMGDSAGGNLAAAAAIQARDEGIALAGQVLLYPVLDGSLEQDSYRRNETGYLLTTQDMEWFWTQYIPDRAAWLTPLASPLRVAETEGLAPAIIVAAEFDPLFDEAHEYAERLRTGGVDVELLDYAGMVHGFMTLFAVTPIAMSSVLRVCALVFTLFERTNAHE